MNKISTSAIATIYIRIMSNKIDYDAMRFRKIYNAPAECDIYAAKRKRQKDARAFAKHIIERKRPPKSRSGHTKSATMAELQAAAASLGIAVSPKAALIPRP